MCGLNGLEAFNEFRAGGVTLINADRMFALDTASGHIGREGLIDPLPGSHNVKAVVPAGVIGSSRPGPESNLRLLAWAAARQRKTLEQLSVWIYS